MTQPECTPNTKTRVRSRRKDSISSHSTHDVLEKCEGGRKELFVTKKY